MNEFGHKSAQTGLEKIPLSTQGDVFWNLSPAELIEQSLSRGEGCLTDSGALMCDTGKFTGRAPDDKYIVRDKITGHQVWWKEFNHPAEPETFARLKNKMLEFLADKDLFVRDVTACSSEKYRINVRVINTHAYHNLFVHNMFLRPDAETLAGFTPDWTIINAPDFKADPEKDGVRSTNFAIINFTEKCVIIGGTGYTGEIKKGIFTVLNFTLPTEHHVLPMHCSANEGSDGQTALFFGLSGTGKTTLSTDPNRKLIGDDEHGWARKEIFNFEGGCYAKVINLSEKGEPDIFKAIRFGSVLENCRFEPGTRKVDFANAEITENTRVSYPIHYIQNVKESSTGVPPSHIFFLTSDAQGVLPPISKLNPEQAMFHFLSGYTAKVAGTEAGVKEPKAVFSSCFGAPFLPLHPGRYASLLGEKLKDAKVHVWLVNTGWIGGPVGVGTRMRLSHTRSLISAALNGELHKVEFMPHPVFGVHMPLSCPGVPVFVLNPREMWNDKAAYDQAANRLATQFLANFEKFQELADEHILAGGPRVLENVV
jgi:phosphoenolpyruvate carboxykinase (ATP)